MTAEGLSRRTFLQVSGGAGVGLVLGLTLPGVAHPSDSAEGPAEIGAWVRIGSDDRVTLMVAKSEMGQGVMTSLPMLLAEELGVSWEQVRVEQAPTDTARYGRQLTGGSRSVRGSWDALRRAGAAAREMLISAAAATWDVERGECSARDGSVVHGPSGRRVRYGALAARAARLEPPADPPLRDPAEFRIVGKSPGRVDTPAKVDGSAVFGIDVRVPGMLVAQVEPCPYFGGRVRSIDAAAARAVDGVRDVVETPRGVGVVARSYWPAQLGRRALRVTWDPGPDAELGSDTIRARCVAAVSGGTVARDDGDVDAALVKAAHTLEAVYEVPYLAHATMEPMNCTAHVREDACEIWAPTQAPERVQEAAAGITGLPAERVTVHTTLLGGGFGRRSETDFVADAVHLSRAVGAPVKLVYTREDDMSGGYYRPVAYNALRGGLDAEGWPVAWEHRIASPSILRSQGVEPRGGIDGPAVEGARNLPYAIDSVRVTWADVESPVPTHWWRSVGSSQNAWVVESFLDELCAAGGKDPLEARLRLLRDHPRHARVARIAAERAGWGGSLPAGHALGLAVHESFGSFVAQVADVSVGSGGVPRVHRVVCVVDCGQVVHPDTVRAQMEGGIAFGLSAALHGEIRLQDGRVAQRNFDSYPIVRIDQMPRVETHIVAEGDAPGGIGEPGTPPIAPAVCNALLALTGTPVRRLPARSV